MIVAPRKARSDNKRSNELRIPIYEARLHRGYRKSIPHLEEKNNPVKHMLAVCSISWQRDRGTVREKAVKWRKIYALPGYATHCRIAAKRCYRTKHRLLVVDWLVSVRRCQDMLQRLCRKVDKIAALDINLRWRT